MMSVKFYNDRLGLPMGWCQWTTYSKPNYFLISTVSIVVMGKFGDLRHLQLELHIVGNSCMQA